VAEFAFAIPVIPGKEDLDRNTMDELLERRDEYEEALRPGLPVRSSGIRKHLGARLLSFTSRPTIRKPRSHTLAPRVSRSTRSSAIK
jgi:hypothetical protein